MTGDGERTAWRRDADVVVVGSGAAGISAALAAAEAGASVLVVTKDLTGGASPLAQGGLAAALGHGDTPSAHASDTVTAGAGLCEPDVVAALAAGSPGAIDWLVTRGARLERRELRLEGGHSRHRIVHSGDDATGAEVHRALLEALLTSGIEILDRTAVLDLTRPIRSLAIGREAREYRDPPPQAVPARPIRSLAIGREAGGHGGWGAGAPPCTGELSPRDMLTPPGLVAATIGPGGVLTPGVISARTVILAAGGLGQVYATTSNPPGATGDAMAIAARAGAVLRDPEFVQFHPTVLWRDGASGQCPLITEALRGAGAVLRDLDGRPVMAGHDPRGDLAPRDVVAARIHEVISSGDGPAHVWLDATALGRGVLEDGFPTVTAACRKQGVDPVTEFIPVAPGAHYSCGGIRAGLDGHTSIPGLYAVGEAASTGVHGANRLASNSLVEAVIAGRRAGSSAAASPQAAASYRAAGAASPGKAHAERADAEARPVLAAAMSRYAGVLRDSAGLLRLTKIIEGAAQRDAAMAAGTGAPGHQAPGLALAEVEAANLREVSALIAAAALRRTESRGCHRRSDTPGTEPGARHTLARLHDGQITMTWEAL